MVGELIQRLRWLLRSSMLRLALLLSVIFGLGMAVAIFVALTLGDDALERRVDETLVSVAATTSLNGARGDTFGMIMRRPNDLGDLPRPFARTAERGGGTFEVDDKFRDSDRWRLLVATDRTGAPIVLAVALEESEEALELLGGILWATVLTVIALILAVGLGAGLLAQRRLKRINETLNDLAAGDLTARTGLIRSKDDLDDMARQLDVTAGELERLVTQTRHLSASLAHDLRTPLARLRARLEMLPEGEARGAALEEAERLSGIFDTIMRVARIEAAQGNDGFEPVDLGALVEDIGETFGPVIEDEGKILHLDVAGSVMVQADRSMIVQALANLIQNAIRHGGDDITLTARGNEIGVTDNGPGVEPTDYAEILKPMVRLDAARNSEGTGLGLALVRAVADRHGATLTLAPNDPQGLRVSMKFADL